MVSIQPIRPTSYDNPTKATALGLVNWAVVVVYVLSTIPYVLTIQGNDPPLKPYRLAQLLTCLIGFPIIYQRFRRSPTLPVTLVISLSVLVAATYFTTGNFLLRTLLRFVSHRQRPQKKPFISVSFVIN